MRKKKKQPLKSGPSVVKCQVVDGFADVKDVTAPNVTKIPDLWVKWKNNDEEGQKSDLGKTNVCGINTDVVSIPSVSPSLRSGSSYSSLPVSGDISVNSSPWLSSTKLLSILKKELQREVTGSSVMNLRLDGESCKTSDFVKNAEISGQKMEKDEVSGSKSGLFYKKLDDDVIDHGTGSKSEDDGRSAVAEMSLLKPVHNLDSPKPVSCLVTADIINPNGENISSTLDYGEVDQTAVDNPPIIEENVLNFVQNIPAAGNVFSNTIGLNFSTGLNSDAGPGPHEPCKSPSTFGPVSDTGPVLNSPAMPLAAGSIGSLSVEPNNEELVNKGPNKGGADLGPHPEITAQHLQFGSFDPSHSRVKPNFDFICDYNIKFGASNVDVDPIRGTKFWNHELFSKLTKGLEVEESETRLFYEPPTKDDDGEFMVDLNGYFMTKSVQAHRLQLFGYFVGDNLPFQVVKENLIKMWHKFGVTSITKKSGGFYFFKFSNDEGLLQVLERNPWLVRNVPLVLQMWEPDTVLSKPDPSVVPVWVTIKDMPLCLWNGGNIGQIVSCIGKPLMLDKATYERCEKKTGPLSFARVLVEANVSNGLPNRVKVKFPSRNCLPGKITFLEFGYKWKPPLCHLCGVFGHMTSIHEPKQHVENGTQPSTDPVPLAQLAKAQSDKAQPDKDGFTEVKKRKNKQKTKGRVTWAPVLQAGKMNGPKQNGAGPSRSAVGAAEPVQSGPVRIAKAVGPDPSFSLKAQSSNMGTGFFDVTNMGTGPVLSPMQNPKIQPIIDASNTNVGEEMKSNFDVSNRYASLGMDDELDDCYDAERGLWEHEIEKAHMFFNSNTRPPDDEYEKWSKELKVYFDGLIKDDEIVPQDEEDHEVESETDESARFMKTD